MNEIKTWGDLLHELTKLSDAQLEQVAQIMPHQANGDASVPLGQIIALGTVGSFMAPEGGFPDGYELQPGDMSRSSIDNQHYPDHVVLLTDANPFGPRGEAVHNLTEGTITFADGHTEPDEAINTYSNDLLEIANSIDHAPTQRKDIADTATARVVRGMLVSDAYALLHDINLRSPSGVELNNLRRELADLGAVAAIGLHGITRIIDAQLKADLSPEEKAILSGAPAADQLALESTPPQ